MKAVKCDSCGDFVERGNTDPDFTLRVRASAIRSKELDGHLCPACTEMVGEILGFEEHIPDRGR